MNEYLSYISKIPQIDISVSSKDSLTYLVSYNNYKNKKYKTSQSSFESYLSEFGKEAIFLKSAQYYYAESCWNNFDTIKAIQGFINIIDYCKIEKSKSYLETSLVRVCRYSFIEKDFSEYYEYYQILDTIASSIGLKKESIIRLMFGFENTNSKLAVKYANRVLQLDKLDDRLISRSKIIIVRDDMDNGNFARASDMCNEIIELTKNNDASEAMYLRSYFSFLEEDYLESERLVFDLAEKYSSNHWISKGFILLSDIYVLKNNKFQAKATLESVIENHDEEDVINTAKKKWEDIIEDEQTEKLYLQKKEVTIGIGEELEYEINYSDLYIEELEN